MEAIKNPYAAQIHSFGKQVLDAQKQVADWQIGQMKQVEKNVATAFDLTRSAAEANVAAAQGMGKTLLDTFAPTEA